MQFNCNTVFEYIVANMQCLTLGCLSELRASWTMLIYRTDDATHSLNFLISILIFSFQCNLYPKQLTVQF